jgi:hypothetical protein
MAITTVRPNATPTGSTLYAITGGSPTIHAALSDDADGTFVQKDTAVTGPADFISDFGTLTLTASQRVKQVRLRARVSTPNDNGRINVYLGALVNRQNYFYTGLAIRGSNTSPTTFTGPYFTSAPDGSEWTQTNINNLRVKSTEYKESTDRGKIYELYVDVDVASQPSVGTVSAPVGSVSTTTPDITWTYVDATDGSTQDYVEIKVFSSAEYNAAGWNVNTSTPTFTTGIVAQTDQNSVVGVLLTPLTYRCYVRVGRDINGTPFFSDWNFSEFTVGYNTQSVPTMVVAWSAPLGRAAFVNTGASLDAGAGITSQYHQVQRSDDEGVTYDFIRNGEEIELNASNESIIEDYEAPRGITAYYRCRAVGIDSNSNERPSGWSVIQQVLITNDSSWWFKCIADSDLNLGSVRVLKELDVQVDEPNTVFRPLGSSYPTIVAGPLQGEDGAYNIKTVTEDEWDDIYPLITHQGKLLVQDPFGNQKYIRITDRKWTAETQSGNIYRDITLTYVEVAEDDSETY